MTLKPLGDRVIVKLVEAEETTKSCILLVATAMMMLFSFTGKRCGRIEGIISLMGYLGYTAYIICRAYGVI